MRTETVILGARVIDGSGAPWFRADVAVAGDVIAGIGKIGPVEGAANVDGTGLYLSPGFVDIHSHSDTVTLIDGRAAAKVMQGVTTEVVGVCGSSAAPLGERGSPEASDMAAALAAYGKELDWASVSEYLSRIEQAGTSVNIATLVGHGTLRNNVIGRDMRPATPAEVARMAELLDAALRDGAFGLSSGLEYPPGFFADVDELAGVARPLASRGGIYASHIRNEDETLMESIREAIAVGRRAGVPVEISHLKVIGPMYWGKVRNALQEIEKAREEGIDVAADAYPYTASSTSLGIVLPDWAHSGGHQATVKRLLDPETRAKLKEITSKGTEMLGGWSLIVVTSVKSPQNRIYEGKNLDEIAREMGLDACEAAFRLLVEEEMQVSIVRHGMSEEDVAFVLASPLVSFCSDGRALAADGPLRRGTVHPRNFGAFARAIAKYARDDRVLRLEEAVRKMTSLPASRARLARRGLIKPGFFADLVLFSLSDIKDTATYLEPWQYPSGIEGVWTNGTRVVESGRHTGRMPGRALRMGRG